MRDAFGSAFMIKIILVFLTVYIAFMAVALNYAKAFRVKNQIINIIEQYEGYYDKGANKSISVKDMVSEYVQQMNYYVELEDTVPNASNGNKECQSNGYCVSTISTSGGTYYVVETFIHLEMPFKLPFMNIKVTVPVRGETKVIKDLF